MSHPIEFNGQKLTAWKTSLHGHTTVSDGWQTPQEIIDRYVEGKYDAINFSDHRKTNPVSTYDAKGLTLISGIELHPDGPRSILWHLLAVNVPEDFPGVYETAEDAIKAVHAVGGIVYIAHPYWCGLTVEELKPIAGLPGVVGCEICNTSCNIIGKDDSDKEIKRKDKEIKKLEDLMNYYEEHKYLVDLTVVSESDLDEMVYTTINVIDAGRIAGTATEDRDAIANAVASVVRNLAKGEAPLSGVASEVKEGETPAVVVEGNIVKVRYIAYS